MQKAEFRRAVGGRDRTVRRSARVYAAELPLETTQSIVFIEQTRIVSAGRDWGRRRGETRSKASKHWDLGKSMGISNWIRGLTAAVLAAAWLFAFSVAAWAGLGQPSSKQIGLQDAATEVAREIHHFYNLVNVIIIAVAIFVLILLVIVVVRFSERANPTPSRVTHNTTLEFLWTVIPIIILVVIAIPSFKLLYLEYSYPKPDLTLKATGNTWYWQYEYPDLGLRVTSAMLKDEDVLAAEIGQEKFDKTYGSLEGVARSVRLKADADKVWKKRGEPRLLAVDNEIAVPVNKVVHVLVTSNDVIHNWTVPSFGSKVDAVPGRVTTTWFRAEKEGIFYGQCSELCGKDHAFMPIAVRVVKDSVFKAWAAALKARDRKKAADILKSAALEQAKKKTEVAQAGVR